MKTLRTLCLALGLATSALLGACGSTVTPQNPAPQPSNPSAPSNPTNPSNPSNPSTPTLPPTAPALSNLGFKAASLLPEQVKDAEQELTPLLVQLVDLARRQGQNNALLSGTLTQNAAGNFAFSATPTDRLRVLWNDGEIYEFAISRFQGNLASGPRAFYKGNHSLQYTAKLKPDSSLGRIDFRLSSLRQGASLQVGIAGTVVFENQSHTVSLDYSQQVLSDIGPGSIEFRHQDTLRGTVSAVGLQLSVNEAFDFRLVGTNSLVMQTVRTFDNSWSEGGQQFRLQNGRIQKVFRDGNPIEADFWRAEGTLLRNGTAVGGLGQAFTGNVLEQFMDTPNGRIRLSASQFNN